MILVFKICKINEFYSFDFLKFFYYFQNFNLKIISNFFKNRNSSQFSSLIFTFTYDLIVGNSHDGLLAPAVFQVRLVRQPRDVRVYTDLYQPDP